MTAHGVAVVLRSRSIHAGLSKSLPPLAGLTRTSGNSHELSPETPNRVGMSGCLPVLAPANRIASIRHGGKDCEHDAPKVIDRRTDEGSNKKTPVAKSRRAWSVSSE
jgi:hypothetical protein